MVATSDDAVKKQWRDGVRSDPRGGHALILGRGPAKSRGQRRESKNRSGAVLRIAEGDDGQRLLYFRDGNTQGDGIHRQHLPRCLSRMYSSRTPGMMQFCDDAAFLADKGCFPGLSTGFAQAAPAKRPLRSEIWRAADSRFFLWNWKLFIRHTSTVTTSTSCFPDPR